MPILIQFAYIPLKSAYTLSKICVQLNSSNSGFSVGLLYRIVINKSRRSLAYHQFQRNCISSKRSFAYHQVAERYTLMRDDIQPKGLMISTTLRAVMIYQVCDLDKKILQKKYHFLQYFLVRPVRLELTRVHHTPLKRTRLPFRHGRKTYI